MTDQERLRESLHKLEKIEFHGVWWIQLEDVVKVLAAPTGSVETPYPRPCGLCPATIRSADDLEWHGLGNCVPICERCTGSGIEPAAPTGSTPSQFPPEDEIHRWMGIIERSRALRGEAGPVVDAARIIAVAVLIELEARASAPGADLRLQITKLIGIYKRISEDKYGSTMEHVPYQRIIVDLEKALEESAPVERPAVAEEKHEHTPLLPKRCCSCGWRCGQMKARHHSMECAKQHAEHKRELEGMK